MRVTEKNAIVIFSGRILGVVISVFYVLIIPSVLGAEGYGYYAFWFSQLFLLVTLLDLGSSETLRRYLPEVFVNDQGESRSLIIALLKMKCLMFPIIAAFLFFHSDKVVFAVIVLASLAATYSRIFHDISFALNWMLRFSQYDLIRKLLRIALLIAGFMIFGLPGVIGALALTEVLVFALFFFGRKMRSPREAIHYHAPQSATSALAY